MSKQVIKTFNGYAVTYNSKRKSNKFVITLHGRVVNAFSDFASCLYYLLEVIPNFEGFKEGAYHHD